MYSFQNNDKANLAIDYIENSNTHLYITGKAGTGKTTFLKYIKDHISKKCVVVAPTGVAALNAESVTIHSFFKLPYSPFVPSQEPKSFKNFISQKKIDIIKNLEVLIIDEISMVRADILDAIDAILRYYRKNQTPFGGIQLIMIGDLYQLPPVVTEEDRLILSEFYSNFYFFDSYALKKIGFKTIEFDYIYRQQDEQFINLLNAIRENKIDEKTYALLKTRHIENFQSFDHTMLTTHNQQAVQINDEFLRSIPHRLHSFEAIIHGNFPESMYPTERNLQLKVGARVMFLKNDTSDQKLYYNGKIGIVQEILDDAISILSEGESDLITIEPMEWQHIHYTFNADKKEIEEEVLGSFIQYPLKLAWAITIHKSQGLTFDKVIIDAKNAFTHGQIYVALSRCRSLKGLTLSSLFNKEAVIVDPAVVDFLKMNDLYHLQ